MKNLSLILRIVAIIAAVAATTLYFISKGKLADMDTELTQTKQVLATTQTELSDTSNTLVQTQTTLKRETASHAKTKETLSNVQSELFAAQQQVEQTNRQLTTTKAELATAEATAKQLRTDLVSTQEELAAASREAEINQLNERIKSLEKTNAELALDLESKTAIADAVTAKQNPSSGSTALGGINTSVAGLPSGEPISRIRLETTINSISTSDGIIVLNSTPELGLAAGQTVTLVQDLKSVGRVRIQSITDTYAVGNILPGSKGTSKLDSGSTVQLLL